MFVLLRERFDGGSDSRRLICSRHQSASLFSVFFSVGTIRLYPRGQFFYHAPMKNTRSSLRLLTAFVLPLLAGTGMATEKLNASANAGLYSNLAADLYQQHSEPVAANFGQCFGGYVLPTHLTPKAVSGDSGDRVITAELDSLVGRQGGVVHLLGNVVINDGQRVLLAEEALLNQGDRRLGFPQGLVVGQNDLVVQGQQASMGLDGESLDLRSVQWLMPKQNFRGTASTLQRSSSGTVVLTDAELTRCSPNNNGWSLGVKELQINEAERFAQAKGAVLRIKSVPVAYLPRMRVAMDGKQSSGWQMPTGGASSRDGLELGFPYYWDVSPVLDAIVTPRLVSRRGVGVDGQIRYDSPSQNATVDLSYLASDDLYNGLFDRKTYKALGGETTLGSFDSADRWLVSVEQEGSLGPLTTRVDFARSSDRDFFRDLDSYVGLVNPNALSQFAEIAYTTNKWDFRVRSLGFQRLDELDTLDFESSPALLLNYRSNPSGQGFTWAMTSQWADFDAQQARFNAGQTAVSPLEGSRTHVEPSLSFRRDGGSGYWALRGGYKFTEYNLDRSPSNLTRYDDQQTDRGIGFFSADAGLFFERDIRLGGERLVHTLEPRIYYLNQGYEAQDSLPVFDSMPLSMTFGQLFSDNRFAGLDRIGDADRLTLAATSRVLSASGRELGSFALAYMDHLSKPRVEWPGPADIGASDLVASEQTLNAKNGWQLRTRQLWNNERSAWEELGASLHLRGSGRRIYNVGVNRRLLDEIEQAEFSAYAPLNHHVAVTSRWHYDIEGHRTLEAFVGLEYDDCCVRFRLLARQYLENPSYRNYGLPQSLLPLDDLRTDRGVLLEVQLKGLAGFGSKVDALLRRSVYGYGSPAGLVR